MAKSQDRRLDAIMAKHKLREIRAVYLGKLSGRAQSWRIDCMPTYHSIPVSQDPDRSVLSIFVASPDEIADALSAADWPTKAE